MGGRPGYLSGHGGGVISGYSRARAIRGRGALEREECHQCQLVVTTTGLEYDGARHEFSEVGRVAIEVYENRNVRLKRISSSTIQGVISATKV